MKTFSTSRTILSVTCLACALSSVDAAAQSAEKTAELNVVVRWNQALLQAVRET